MKHLIFAFLAATALSLSPNSFAQGGDWNFSYGALAGTNSVQGFHFTFYGQLATSLDENWEGGLGAHISAGEKPSHDREWGVGPFVTYGVALHRFFGVYLRQEINYVDLFDPYLVSTDPDVWDHEQETGFASSTSAGANIFLGGGITISGGYRFVIALTNEALDDGRSGPYFSLHLSF